MPDINNKYQYTEEEKLLVYMLLEDESFTFRDWQNPILAALRKHIRDFYRREQTGRCVYCRQNISLRSVNNCHIEHIAAKSIYHSFIFEPKNMFVICADCNEIKRGQETLNQVVDNVIKGKDRKAYPRTTNAFLIYHPHFDKYEDHIEIVGNYFYVDKTKKGHFTIGACRLNRKLYEFGWQREIVDESKIVQIMNDFLKEKNIIKRAHLLKKIQNQIVSI